ncbi:MAG: hypothetical protein RSF77_07705, partial [Oscillospiraceae bacterium]
SQTESESVVLPLHNPAIWLLSETDARVIILYFDVMSRLILDKMGKICAAKNAAQIFFAVRRYFAK